MARSSYNPITCRYELTFEKAGVDEVKKMLDPSNVLGTGCRVIKHPDCCLLCANNDDCDRLPMHANCRCEPEPYLMTEA